MSSSAQKNNGNFSIYNSVITGQNLLTEEDHQMTSVGVEKMVDLFFELFMQLIVLIKCHSSSQLSKTKSHTTPQCQQVFLKNITILSKLTVKAAHYNPYLCSLWGLSLGFVVIN